MKKNQNGFAHIEIIILLLILITVIGFAGFKILDKNNSESTINSSAQDNKNNNDTEIDPNEPPVLIEHIGINLAPYDPVTNMAGDLEFTKTGLESYGGLIFFEYGDIAEANSASDSRKNPQPTFIVPLGTKVHSLISGIVVNVEKLYSNDYSVMVSDEENSQWIYELEHVINPTVKVGDKVKAGQEVAEVSTHDSQYHPGFGLYEIGILHGGSPPEHVCIFEYLSPSIKQKTFDDITRLYSDWEAYMGDTNLYNEATNPIPGCQTLDPIQG